MDWIAPGAVLAGKYALERKLGQGGMGAVWRAEHVQLRSPVAIKVIDQQIASSPDALSRFLREAQSAAALRSPHVVQILDFGADRGVPYIAMELLEGESLADRLARLGRMPPAEIARLITQIARALSKAHEMGIVHRDIKPDNIFIVRNDEDDVAKVLDFGIAKSSQGLGVGSGSTTRTGAILGTPNYMSPEQAEGTKQVDHRTDLWALGVIVFEALVGRRPFDSDALGSLLLAICTRPIPIPSQYGYQHPGFDAWFARACSRELNERFQSARELATELRRICGVADARDAAASLPGPDGRVSAPQTPFGAAQTPYGAPQTPYGAPATPYGPAPQTPYGASHPISYTHVPAPALPTANSYAASVSVSTRRRPIAAFVVAGLVTAAAAAVAVMVIGGRNTAELTPGAVTAAAATPPKPVVEPAPVVAATAPPAATTPPAPEVVPAPSVPASAPAAEADVQAAPAANRRPRPFTPARKPAKAAAPLPAPAPVPAPAPPEPRPEPKVEPKPPSNKVNLGI